MHDEMRLERLQNRSARLVTCIPLRTSTDKLRKELGWDKLKTRRKIHRLTFYRQLVHSHDTTPSYIQHILPQTRHTDTGHTLRNANNSTTILTKTTSFYRSFVPNTTRQWNLLPETIRSETSTNKFKKQLSELYSAAHPPDLYLAGSKTGNADHTKIRCGSFELNSYLHQIQKSNSPACACGYRIENTSHFVLHCPIYQRIRAELFGNISMILNFNFSSLPSSEKLSILLDGVSLDTGSGRLVARHFQNYLQEAKQLR